MKNVKKSYIRRKERRIVVVFNESNDTFIPHMVAYCTRHDLKCVTKSLYRRNLIVNPATKRYEISGVRLNTEKS